MQRRQTIFIILIVIVFLLLNGIFSDTSFGQSNSFVDLSGNWSLEFENGSKGNLKITLNKPVQFSTTAPYSGVIEIPGASGPFEIVCRSVLESSNLYLPYPLFWDFATSINSTTDYITLELVSPKFMQGILFLQKNRLPTMKEKESFTARKK